MKLEEKEELINCVITGVFNEIMHNQLNQFKKEGYFSDSIVRTLYNRNISRVMPTDHDFMRILLNIED